MLLRPVRTIAAPFVPANTIIRPQHRLARGLIGAWLPGVTQGINLVGLSPPLAPDTAVSYGVGPEGIGLKSTAANAGMTVLAPSRFTNWNELSFFWRGQSLGQRISGNAAYISVDYDNAASSPYVVAGIYNQGSAGQAVAVLFWNTGGTFTTSTITSALTNNQVYSLGASFTVGGNASLYNNGLQVVANSFGASAPNTSATSTIATGVETSLGARSPNCITEVIYAWNREITAVEQMELHADPFFLFAPQSVAPLWINSIGGGGFTAKFRKTLSPIAGRIGSRQPQGWAA